MELRHLNGLEVEQCIRCGAVVLDRADLEELTGSAVINAPNPRAADPGPARTPPPREKRKPWDYTPAPPPPRVPEGLDSLLPDFPEPDETTEEAPLLTGHRLHESEPPVRKRLSAPPPPPPLDMHSIRPRSAPDVGAIVQNAGKMKRPPPPPPNVKSISPESADEPALGHRGDVTLSEEPGVGDLSNGIDSDEPSFDLAFDPDADSTEEAPLMGQEVDHDDVLGAWEKRRRRRRLFLGLLVIALLSVVAGGIAAAIAFQAVVPGRTDAPEPSIADVTPRTAGDVVEDPELDLEQPTPTPEPTEAAVAPPAPKPAVAPTPEPAVAPPQPKPVEPEPVVVAPTPEPAPVVAPAPAPAPKKPSRQALIDRGWAQVESDPDAAARAFAAVLADHPGDHEANYGYGYAMLEKGNLAEAGPYLCRAKPSPDVTVQREVSSLLTRNGLTCN